MKSLNICIVVCYSFGLAIGYVFNAHSLLLWSFVLSTLSAIALVLLNSYLRNRLSTVLFNLLFCSSLIIGFSAFGVQRNILHNQLKTSALEERMFEISEGAKERFAEFAESPGENLATVSITKVLLVGDKSSLDRAVKQNFREAGVAHTLALSGLHVGIVWSFFTLLLFFLGCSLKMRKVRLFIIMPLIFGYAFITGLSNSVVRAAIMLSLWQINHLYGRKNSGSNSILATAFIILLINPASLRSISFQLSFAAVLGIAIMYPVMNESILWLGDKIKVRIVKKAVVYSLQMMGISIACQIFTLPVVLYYFGTTPQHFLISNLAVIPSVTLTIYSSSLTLMGGVASTLFSSLTPIATLFASVTERVVTVLLSLAHFLAV